MDDRVISADVLKRKLFDICNRHGRKTLSIEECIYAIDHTTSVNNDSIGTDVWELRFVSGRYNHSLTGCTKSGLRCPNCGAYMQKGEGDAG